MMDRPMSRSVQNRNMLCVNEAVHVRHPGDKAARDENQMIFREI